MHVPIRKVFVNCFLHVLTTHPALRKGYFLPPEVIKSKSYTMVIGCCMPTSTHSVQQDLDLPPHISAITCVPLHKCCGHVIKPAQSKVKVTSVYARNLEVCAPSELQIYTHCCLGVWTHHTLTSMVIACTETSAAHGFTWRCLPTLTQIRGILL